jgi:hypothetical protein
MGNHPRKADGRRVLSAKGSLPGKYVIRAVMPLVYGAARPRQLRRSPGPAITAIESPHLRRGCVLSS